MVTYSPPRSFDEVRMAHHDGHAAERKTARIVGICNRADLGCDNQSFPGVTTWTRGRKRRLPLYCRQTCLRDDQGGDRQVGRPEGVLKSSRSFKRELHVCDTGNCLGKTPRSACGVPSTVGGGDAREGDNFLT